MFTRRSLAAMSAALVAPFAVRPPVATSEPADVEVLPALVLGPPIHFDLDLRLNGVDAGPVRFCVRRERNTGIWMFAPDQELRAVLVQAEAAEIARREAAGEPALIVI